MDPTSLGDELQEIDDMLLHIYKEYFEYSTKQHTDQRNKFIIMINGIKKAIKYGKYNYLTKWFVNFTIFAVESKQPLACIISERILFYISHILLTKITVVAITHFELFSYINTSHHCDSISTQRESMLPIQQNNITSIIEYNTNILSLMLIYMNEYKLNDKQKFNGFAALNTLATSGIDKLCTMVNTSPHGQSKLVGFYSPMMLILIIDPTSIFKNSIYTVKSIKLDVFKKTYCDYIHFEIAYSVLFADVKRLRIVREQTHPRCCATCKSLKLKLLICKSCKSGYYCNKECQKSDWHIHRKICISKKELYDNMVAFVQSLVYP